jgi:O-antigen ligase
VSGAVLLSCIGLFPGWRKMLPGLGALAAIYCVILSQSRGTWLALFPMGLIAGLVYIKFRHLADFRKAGPSRKKFAVYLVVLLLLATGLGYQFGDGMVKRVTTAAENYSIYKADRTQFSSLAIRLELWYSTWLSFKEAPITGIGSDNRIEYLAELESAGKIHLGSYPWRHAHSDYLDRLQRQGLPAMIL